MKVSIVLPLLTIVAPASARSIEGGDQQPVRGRNALPLCFSTGYWWGCTPDSTNPYCASSCYFDWQNLGSYTSAQYRFELLDSSTCRASAKLVTNEGTTNYEDTYLYLPEQGNACFGNLWLDDFNNGNPDCQFAAFNVDPDLESGQCPTNGLRNDTPAPAPQQDANPDTDGCFSGDTTVRVQNAGVVPMKDLRVGDMVMTKGNRYQEVYSFGHREEDVRSEFYQIYTEKNKEPLEMTANHLVFVESESKQQAIRADRVRVGDALVKPSGGTVLVTKVSTATKTGLFMPLTADGTIVVQETVVASTYVSIQEDAPAAIGEIASFVFSQHSLSHWWMSPYRMACLGVSPKLCGQDPHRRSIDVLPWLLAGRDLARFSEVQPMGFGARVLIGVPVLVLFAALNLVEILLGGPSWAPLVVAALALVAAWNSRRRSLEAVKKSK